MLSSAFDLGQEIELKKVFYPLHQPMWSKYDLTAINIEFSQWTQIKYLNDDGTDFSDQISTLPDNRGGLYMFLVKCAVIKGLTEFPFYIGRAQLTDGQNLRKRCKEYFLKYRLNNERPKITRMFRYWDKDLYLCYIPLDDNEVIRDFEKKLINSLLLPMNDQIPDQEIRQAIKAFQQ